MREHCSDFENRINIHTNVVDVSIARGHTASTLTMARTAGIRYETTFESVIRGHHIYKDFWNPILGEILIVKPDTTDSGAREIDRYTMGVFENDDGVHRLVGHAPRELSRLLHDFYHHGENSIRVQVMGARTKENGLVVPGTYQLITRNKGDTAFLDKKLAEMNNLEEACVGYVPKTKYKYLYTLFFL